MTDDRYDSLAARLARLAADQDSLRRGVGRMVERAAVREAQRTGQALESRLRAGNLIGARWPTRSETPDEPPGQQTPLLHRLASISGDEHAGIFEPAASIALADFIRHGVPGGSFQMKPPLGPGTNLSNANAMPYISAPVQVSGNSVRFVQEKISQTRLATTAPYLRLAAEMTLGSAGDEGYVELMIPLDGSGAADYIALPWIGVAARTSVLGGNILVGASAAFMAEDKTTLLGSASEQTMTWTALAAMSDARYRLQPAPSFLSRAGFVPPSARWMRLRLFLRRGAASAGGFANFAFEVARLQTGYTQVLIADSGTPATYGYATLYQQDGVLWIAPAQGSHSGANIKLNANGDADITVGPDAGDNINIYRSGEAQPRYTFDLDASGGSSIYLGPGGASSPDVRIYRAAADILATDDVLRIVGKELQVPEIAAPSTPAAGFYSIYAKTDSRLWAKSDAGTERQIDLQAADMTDLIAKSIVDAKGDLIAATAADTVARLAVGANGTVLTADSAETTGLKWAAAAGLDWDGTVTKAADQSRADTTLVADTALFKLLAAGLHLLEIVIRYSNAAGGAPDLKLEMGEDATGRSVLAATGVSDAEVDQVVGHRCRTGILTTWGTTVAERVIYIRGVYVSAGGTFQISWAQNTANATPTKVLAGSFIKHKAV